MKPSRLFSSAELLALQAYPHILLALSGGLDSMVLLHALSQCPELQSKIQLLHVHHGLSPNADAWAAHCQEMAKRFFLPLHVEYLQLPAGSNLEERAREARYACFARHLPVGAVLLTAHHQQDQAETLLAHLCRGAGVAGLAAMAETQRFAKGFQHRPLLNTPKAVLLKYALEHELSHIEDESNANTQFTRNFFRQHILPPLAERFPAVAANLARTAEICAEAESILQADAQTVLKSCLISEKKMAIRQFLTHSPARRRNALHSWLSGFARKAPRRDFIVRIEEELMLAKPDADPVLQFDEWCLRRYQDTLYILTQSVQTLPKKLVWHDFSKSLVFAGHTLELRGVTPVFIAGGAITVQCRVGGERILCRGQHKSVKKLLQAAAIPPWQRASWPLLYKDDTLVAIPGIVLGDAWRQYFPDVVALVVNGQ